MNVRSKFFWIALTGSFLFLAVWVSYRLERTEFSIFIGLYGCLFVGYALGWFAITKKQITFSWKVCVLGALAVRLSLVGALPNLSDDFYRFIWDGRLWAMGINPFQYLPSDLIQSGLIPSSNFADLYPIINSPNYYTIYPFCCQAVFRFSVWLFPTNLWASVVVMKCIFVLVECSTLLGLVRLLKKLQLPAANLYLYAFNPLIILEFVGNLHFEAVSIMWLVWLFVFLLRGAWWRAGICCILAISTKLLPLILLPGVWRYMGLKRGFWFCSGVGIGVIGLFLPFLDFHLLNNMVDSIRLYFQTFEFNGSVYYLLKYIVLPYFEYDLFVEKTIRILLPVITLISILWISWCRHWSGCPKGLLTTAMWSFLVYFLLTRTVHPWYISFIIVWSIFTSWRFVIFWSGGIMLTYVTYQFPPDYAENFTYITVVYLSVLCYALYEFKAQPVAKIF